MSEDDRPFGHDVGTAAWLDALLADQIAEATETPADYRGVDQVMDQVGLELSDDFGEDLDEGLDTDVEGDVDDVGDRRPAKTVVFPPLPPGAGVDPQTAPRFRPEPEPDEFTKLVRAHIATLPPSGKKRLRLG